MGGVYNRGSLWGGLYGGVIIESPYGRVIMGGTLWGSLWGDPYGGVSMGAHNGGPYGGVPILGGDFSPSLPHSAAPANEKPLLDFASSAFRPPGSCGREEPLINPQLSTH